MIAVAAVEVVEAVAALAAVAASVVTVAASVAVEAVAEVAAAAEDVAEAHALVPLHNRRASRRPSIKEDRRAPCLCFCLPCFRLTHVSYDVASWDSSLLTLLYARGLRSVFCQNLRGVNPQMFPCKLFTLIAMVRFWRNNSKT